MMLAVAVLFAAALEWFGRRYPKWVEPIFAGGLIARAALTMGLGVYNTVRRRVSLRARP